MRLKLLSFDEALTLAEQCGKKHLLLGNGFSIACRPDIFAYGSLFEEAKKTMSKELVAIFAAIRTQDFEEVIDQKEAEADAERLMSGEFSLEDFLDQIRMIQKMGSLKDLVDKGGQAVKTGVPKEEADKLAKELKDAGAEVEIK